MIIRQKLDLWNDFLTMNFSHILIKKNSQGVWWLNSASVSGQRPPPRVSLRPIYTATGGFDKLNHRRLFFALPYF